MPQIDNYTNDNQGATYFRSGFRDAGVGNTDYDDLTDSTSGVAIPAHKFNHVTEAPEIGYSTAVASLPRQGAQFNSSITGKSEADEITFTSYLRPDDAAVSALIATDEGTEGAIVQEIRIDANRSSLLVVNVRFSSLSYGFGGDATTVTFNFTGTGKPRLVHQS